MNEYKLMIAPFHHNGFRSLSKKLAEEYFHWYVGQSKERIEQLYEYARSTGGAAFLCEYTPDSLIELWNWFETQIDMVAKSEEEYQAELKQFPE